MTCTHCGKEIDNDLAFCPYCGSRTENGAAAAEKPAKKNPRRFALPVAAAALLAVVGVGLANRKPSIAAVGSRFKQLPRGGVFQKIQFYKIWKGFPPQLADQCCFADLPRPGDK